MPIAGFSPPASWAYPSPQTSRRPLPAASARESRTAASVAGSGNFVGPGGAPISEEQFRGLRRISLLLERLEAEAVEGDISKSTKKGQILASRALSVAARHSESDAELDQHLERLRSLGLEVSTQDIFRALGQVTPAWVAPAGAETQKRPPRPHSALETMRRLVTQTDDPGEIDKRYQELVRAAVERLNEGSLAQGVAMLDLAEQLASEKKVDLAAVEAARRKGDEGIDFERLRRFAEIPEQHPLLRRVLNFFIALTPSSLFDGLVGETRRGGAGGGARPSPPAVDAGGRRRGVLFSPQHALPAAEAFACDEGIDGRGDCDLRPACRCALPAAHGQRGRRGPRADPERESGEGAAPADGGHRVGAQRHAGAAAQRARHEGRARPDRRRSRAFRLGRSAPGTHRPCIQEE